MAVSTPALAQSTLAAIRYGYGLRPGEQPPADAEALLGQLGKAAKQKARFPREGIAARKEATTRILSLRNAEAKAAKEGKPNEDIRKQTQREAQRIYRQDAMARIAQAMQSPYGFHERLASFWVNHFSTSAIKAFPMRMIVPLHEAEAIRPNLAGPFSTLLKAAVMHPAMLIYLDQNQSIAPESAAGRKTGKGLNENLGRELLELHTLGADSGYSQDDVRAAARILTGLSVASPAMELVLMPNRAETGPVTLLGRTYEDDGDGQDHIAMLDDLAADPRTATHICRKLVSHFISDEAPQDVVTAMTGAWSASGGNLTEVYRAMLNHPRAWSDPGQKIKQPFEFIVSSFRALGMQDGNFADLAKAVDGVDDSGPVGAVGKVVDRAVSKAMQMAGSMAGSSSTAASEPPAMTPSDAAAAAGTEREVKAKAGRASAMTIGALNRMGQPIWQPPSPAGFTDRADAWLSASQLSERIEWARMVASIFDQKLQPTVFLDTALADAAGPQTRKVISQAPNRVHGITMVMASPEFNRR